VFDGNTRLSKVANQFLYGWLLAVGCQLSAPDYSDFIAVETENFVVQRYTI
jgi:hypothetical protein